MNPVWSVVLVLVAFVIILRLKHRRKGHKDTPAKYAPRIEGFQVCAFLSPQVGAGCLFDHGMQYGKGFRRKVSPALPHDEHCQCTTIPFVHTSTEVFHGALRNTGVVRSSIEGLPQEFGQRLAERLKEMTSQPLPEKVNEYIALAGVTDWDTPMEPQIEQFLSERHAYLTKIQADGGQTQTVDGNQQESETPEQTQPGSAAKENDPR